MQNNRAKSIYFNELQTETTKKEEREDTASVRNKLISVHVRIYMKHKLSMCIPSVDSWTNLGFTRDTTSIPDLKA